MTRRGLLDEGDLGRYPNSYYAATASALAPFPPASGAHSYDVAIIGGGYTGLSAALELAERGYSVVVLEAQRVGWGASGRNGGQVGSGQRLDQITLESKFGTAEAHRLWTLAEAAKVRVKSLIGKYQIACDFKPGLIYTDHKRRFSRETEAYVAHLNRHYGYGQISYLDRAELADELGTDAYHSASLDLGAGHLHPLNFALGLAQAAIAAGATIHEGTRVTEIKRGPKVRIRASKAEITADNLIVACNGYLGALDGKTARRVMPINSYIIATEPLREREARGLITNDYGVADSRFVVNYFRLSADRRLLFGGRESYRDGVPAAEPGGVRQRMLTIYPQLQDTAVDYSWGGTIAITLNRLPYIARPESNVLVASGYSGHGVALATLCGQLMGEAIAGQAERFDVMARVPHLRFPGGTAFRRPLLVMAMLYYALRDRL